MLTYTDMQVVVVNDYMEAYHWLRDKTPKDSRVMSWYEDNRALIEP